jgi:peptidoglycan/xylan/chitin deacetylase (PgdA/CDA1 family)
MSTIDGLQMNKTLRALCRRVAEESFARLLLWSGIAHAIRRLLWRDRILIVVYHDPAPETMELHLKYLCKIAQPVTVCELNHRPSGRPRVVVTIDDGYAGNKALRDVFKMHNVRPTIFLCSSIVGTCRQFWQHSDAAAAQFEPSKRLKNSERVSRLAALGFHQEAEMTKRAALSAQDIEQMKETVDFQSHGRFHPILTRCSDEECDVEIAQSRQEIERLVGYECLHFAYPFGNYGEREIAFLKSAGYRSARTLDVGWNDEKTDPFRLKAVVICDTCSWAWLAAELSLIPTYLRYLRRGSFFGRFPQF